MTTFKHACQQKRELELTYFSSGETNNGAKYKQREYFIMDTKDEEIFDRR